MQQRKNIISLATASGATPLEEEVGGWPLKELIVESEKSVCLCVWYECVRACVCGAPSSPLN